ncbi:Lrp/AsnC ligand binding domain-containing protein [Aeromicrobium sp.]|uniref:Lrp/AsnC ligand binding domain-containing protein n=1 Tax=Aeromicrobium sp. TaxID=1871063 RepID=UPI003515BA3F
MCPDVLAGDHDYLLKVVAESFAGYEQLLRDRIRDVPSLASVETTFAFGVTKDPSPVPVP